MLKVVLQRMIGVLDALIAEIVDGVPDVAYALALAEDVRSDIDSALVLADGEDDEDNDEDDEDTEYEVDGDEDEDEEDDDDED
jgi:hypothetical protein